MDALKLLLLGGAGVAAVLAFLNYQAQTQTAAETGGETGGNGGATTTTEGGQDSDSDWPLQDKPAAQQTTSPVLYEVIRLAGSGWRNPWEWQYYWYQATGRPAGSAPDPHLDYPDLTTAQIAALKLSPEQWWATMQSRGMGSLRGVQLARPSIGGDFRGVYVTLH